MSLSLSASRDGDRPLGGLGAGSGALRFLPATCCYVGVSRLLGETTDSLPVGRQPSHRLYLRSTHRCLESDLCLLIWSLAEQGHG